MRFGNWTIDPDEAAALTDEQLARRMADETGSHYLECLEMIAIERGHPGDVAPRRA